MYNQIDLDIYQHMLAAHNPFVFTTLGDRPGMPPTITHFKSPQAMIDSLQLQQFDPAIGLSPFIPMPSPYPQFLGGGYGYPMIPPGLQRMHPPQHQPEH